MSRPCDNCCIGAKKKLFKSVKMFLDNEGKIVYLCRPCARELGYGSSIPVESSVSA
jgi:hypothetical protein